MAQIASENTWGEAFALTGGALVVVGLRLWLKLYSRRPVALWLRAVTAGLLLLKLLFVISIFYLAARESTATPIFSVMLLGVFVLLLSALDELELIEQVGNRVKKWRH